LSPTASKCRIVVDEDVGAIRDRPTLVERVDEDDTVVLRLHVAEEDLGKVIGRQGRIARALRTIVRAGSAREQRRVQLEIVD